MGHLVNTIAIITFFSGSIWWYAYPNWAGEVNKRDISTITKTLQSIQEYHRKKDIDAKDRRIKELEKQLRAAQVKKSP